MFDLVIQEVCDSSQVDFEESGVDQQTLLDLRQVCFFVVFSPMVSLSAAGLSREGECGAARRGWAGNHRLLSVFYRRLFRGGSALLIKGRPPSTSFPLPPVDFAYLFAVYISRILKREENRAGRKNLRRWVLPNSRGIPRRHNPLLSRKTRSSLLPLLSPRMHLDLQVRLRINSNMCPINQYPLSPSPAQCHRCRRLPQPM